MADSVDRVFAHALSTVRKIPRTGSARPPSADRLKLYGLYKQSMEGDVAHIMPRPLPASLADPETETFPDPATLAADDLAEAEANSSPEERAEVEKWEAWKACEGLSRTEAKRRYITTLIQTMHLYASGTPEARSLVEELEFVWEQVSGNYNGSNNNGGSGSKGRSGSGASGNSGSGNSAGLRVLRPMSEEGGDGSFRERSIAEVMERESSGGNKQPDGYDDDELEAAAAAARRRRRSRSGSGQSGSGAGGGDTNAASSSDHEAKRSLWRRRMERALVQMTAEVAALKELVDATNSQRRLWARSGKRGWVLWALAALWKLAKRALVDAVVIAAALVILRWRYRERVEEWWERLGEFMGFVRYKIKKRDVAGLLGR